MPIPKLRINASVRVCEMCVIVLGKGDKEFTLSPRKKADHKLASPSTSISSANPSTSISSANPASLPPTDSHAAAATGAEFSVETTDEGGAVAEWSYESSTAEMKVAPRSE